MTALVAVLLATLLSFAVARTITRPLAAITDVMREVAATGDLTRKIALGRQPVGRRRRAAAGHDVQHADRLDRAVPARDVAEGAAVVARPAVHGHRPRDPQPADDHQGGAAHAAAARSRARRALREAVTRHRRRGRAAQPDRQRGARLRAGRSASSWRPRTSTRSAANRPPPRRQRQGRPCTLDLDRVAAAGDDRRRAAAHRARQPDRQCPARRRGA